MQLTPVRSCSSRLRWLRAASYLFAIAATAILGSASESLAVPITLPTGLNPGDQYRLAFVTSTTRDATSADIAVYNAFVTGVANSVTQLAALGTTWTAIASTSAVSARDNTSTSPSVNGTGVRIFLLNDTKLADNNADLWDTTIDTAFDKDQNGAQAFTGFSWTGTATDGSISTSGPLGSSLSVRGAQYVTNGAWITVTPTEPFNASHSIYAISGILTAIPEPGTAALLMLGLIALGVTRRTF